MHVMKKLGKLTLNEMHEFVPLNAEEQMAMKGGNWFRLIPIAWELAKGIHGLIYGSGSSSQETSNCACLPGSTYIQEADSIFLSNGTAIYGSRIVCIPPSN